MAKKNKSYKTQPKKKKWGVFNMAKRKKRIPNWLMVLLIIFIFIIILAGVMILANVLISNISQGNTLNEDTSKDVAIINEMTRLGNQAADYMEEGNLLMEEWNIQMQKIPGEGYVQDSIDIANDYLESCERTRLTYNKMVNLMKNNPQYYHTDYDAAFNSMSSYIESCQSNFASMGRTIEQMQYYDFISSAEQSLISTFLSTLI